MQFEKIFREFVTEGSKDDEELRIQSIRACELMLKVCNLYDRLERAKFEESNVARNNFRRDRLYTERGNQNGNQNDNRSVDRKENAVQLK